ncbi:uncharacterized protein LOC113560036 [Rhopalosiphum maidis]|uniref:uncharacterized protein LOC113560036 n=1 Tax=Rhopalosiphum maidis TaxID=43146 RepID=UPI000EFE289B|nr:uncharacterized protein LOC113560036 [Rhopalosiphum maidis]
MLTYILLIGFIAIFILIIIWFMIIEDYTDGLSAKQQSAPVKFERLSTLHKLNCLINKLEELELQNLSPCKTKLETVVDRLKSVNRFQIKSELLYKDELMQYERAIDWIKSPAEFRNRCGPPNIFPAYSPLTNNDMKQLAKLTLPSVDFTRVPVGPLRWSVASGETSLPVVEQWLTNVFWLMIKTLEEILNLKDKVYSWNYTDHFAEYGGLIKFLRHAIVVSAEEDMDGKKTIFILDFMVPPNVILDRIPEVNATGLPMKPLRGLCCIPVKYTE